MPSQNPSTSSNQRGPTIVKSRKQSRNVTQPSPSDSELNLSDFSCNICFEILVEPIKLVCNHELCLVCFRSMIVNKNFKCPMCRLSIPCVYRKKRESNLRLFVDDTRWNAIKQAFPDEVEKRIEDEKRKKEEERKNTRLIRQILRMEEGCSTITQYLNALDPSRLEEANPPPSIVNLPARSNPNQLIRNQVYRRQIRNQMFRRQIRNQSPRVVVPQPSAVQSQVTIQSVQNNENGSFILDLIFISGLILLITAWLLKW